VGACPWGLGVLVPGFLVLVCGGGVVVALCLHVLAVWWVAVSGLVGLLVLIGSVAGAVCSCQVWVWGP